MAIYHLYAPDAERKTLCGRDITYRYKVVQNDQIPVIEESRFDRMCARCRARAIREGIMRPTVGEISETSGDKHHDAWLARLGVGE